MNPICNRIYTRRIKIKIKKKNKCCFSIPTFRKVVQNLFLLKSPIYSLAQLGWSANYLGHHQDDKWCRENSSLGWIIALYVRAIGADLNRFFMRRGPASKTAKVKIWKSVCVNNRIIYGGWRLGLLKRYRMTSPVE